jgi:hypothetical protein
MWSISDWRRTEKGDIWDYAVESRPVPVAYKVRDGWMIAGIRTILELRDILARLETGE